MRRNLIFIIAYFFITPLGFALEQPTEYAVSEILDFKDPFVSLLPKKEPAKIEVTTLKPATKTEKAQEQEKEIVLPSIEITGIVWNTNRPQAIVNGHVVGIGDKIDDMVISDIRRSGIDILYLGKHFTIKPDEKMAKSKNGNTNFNPMRKLR